MMTVDEARRHIGHGVVYCNAYGEREDGVITSVGETLVFVRYVGDQSSKATNPRDLTLLGLDKEGQR